MFNFLKRIFKAKYDYSSIKKKVKDVLHKASLINSDFEKFIQKNLVSGLEYEVAPVKNFDRAYQKVIKEKDGDVGRLKDSYRASVYFKTLDQLYLFINNIFKGKDKNFEIYFLEDSFYPDVKKSKIKINHEMTKITSRLYRDIKMIVKDKKYGIFGEIQLHFHQYRTVKDETYRLYNLERELVDSLSSSRRKKFNKRRIKKLLYFRKSTIALNELAVVKYNVDVGANGISFKTTKDIIKEHQKRYDITDFDYCVYYIIIGKTLSKRGLDKNFYLKEFYKNDLDFIKSVIA